MANEPSRSRARRKAASPVGWAADTAREWRPCGRFLSVQLSLKGPDRFRGARCSTASTRAASAWFEGRPIRKGYPIADGDKLAGTGAHSYSTVGTAAGG